MIFGEERSLRLIMEMTIEEAIKQLTTYSIPCGKYKNAYDMAIETMRKYQKIVQIMERTVDDGTSMYDTLQEIEEVIEDGSN